MLDSEHWAYSNHILTYSYWILMPKIHQYTLPAYPLLGAVHSWNISHLGGSPEYCQRVSPSSNKRESCLWFLPSGGWIWTRRLNFKPVKKCSPTAPKAGGIWNLWCLHHMGCISCPWGKGPFEIPNQENSWVPFVFIMPFQLLSGLKLMNKLKHHFLSPSFLTLAPIVDSPLQHLMNFLCHFWVDFDAKLSQIFCRKQIHGSGGRSLLRQQGSLIKPVEPPLVTALHILSGQSSEDVHYDQRKHTMLWPLVIIRRMRAKWQLWII